MNFLKKGPELKLSEIKVPGFVEDVYYDLKDRHLLPVAAILLVAIIAIPFALGGSDSSGESGSEGAAESGASISSASQGANLAVARSAPGLREFDRRLDHLQAKNPFKQQYADTPGSDGGGSSSGAGSEGSSSTPSPSGTESSESPSSYAPPSEPSEEGGPNGELTYYSYAIDVRVAGGAKGKKATVRRELPTLTMLPSRETPAIVYMGATKDGKKAVMTVSSDVQAIFGDGKCVLGTQTCQLLVMEPGLPETFVYGGNEKTYKIEILKIHLVESDELNRAPLGDPKKNEGRSKRQTLAAEAAQLK
jgi:hypothetical protein